MDLMFGAVCGISIFGIVDALSAADVRLAGVVSFFLLCFLAWWIVDRQRGQKPLDQPPD